MKKGYVYKITSPSGKIYIGSTDDIKRRKIQYKNLKRNFQWKIKNSIDKYGWDNHIFEIIWEGEANERLKIERNIGLLLNVLDRKIGLNLKLPNDGALPIVYSEETIEKMKLSRLGKEAYWNNEILSLYDLNGNYLRSISSINNCAKEFNVSRELISSILSGRIKSLNKTFQLRKGNNKNNIGISKSRKGRNDKGKSKLKNKKKVLCVEDNQIFDSLTQASEYYNISITTISNILHGKSKKARNGKSFRFL